MGWAKGVQEPVIADKFLALEKDGERASLSWGSITPILSIKGMPMAALPACHPPCFGHWLLSSSRPQSLPELSGLMKNSTRCGVFKIKMSLSDQAHLRRYFLYDLVPVPMDPTAHIPGNGQDCLLY